MIRLMRDVLKLKCHYYYFSYLLVFIRYNKLKNYYILL